MNLETFIFKLKEVESSTTLRLCDVSDAKFVFHARSNTRRNEYLSSVSGGVVEQEKWLADYKIRELEGHELYFIIEAEGADVGLMRLYGYKEKMFSWGSWIILPNAPSKTAYTSAMMCYEIGFGVLGKQIAYFEVDESNVSVWKFHERCGAKLVKIDGGEKYYEITKAEYLKLRKKWSKFLPLKLEL